MFASFCSLPGFFTFWSLLTISLIPHLTSFYFYFPGIIWEHIALHVLLSLLVCTYQLGHCQVLLDSPWTSNFFRPRSLSWLCEGKLTTVFYVLCAHKLYPWYHFLTLQQCTSLGANALFSFISSYAKHFWYRIWFLKTQLINVYWWLYLAIISSPYQITNTLILS